VTQTWTSRRQMFLILAGASILKIIEAV
jgi:hypothetical protein